MVHLGVRKRGRFRLTFLMSKHHAEKPAPVALSSASKKSFVAGSLGTDQAAPYTSLTPLPLGQGLPPWRSRRMYQPVMEAIKGWGPPPLMHAYPHNRSVRERVA